MSGAAGDARQHVPEPVEQSASGFMPGVEILRGVAASAVVVEHTWALTTMSRFWGYHLVEGLGEWGVALFFLISGYILSDYFWRPRQQRSVLTFWTRRLFRIAPAYYVNVGLLFLFFASYNLVESAYGLRQVLASATFTDWMFPNYASSLNVNGALWTLTIEMTLYLVLPLMAPPMRQHKWLTFAVIFGTGMLFRAYVTWHGSALVHLYFGYGKVDLANAHLYLSRQFPGALPLFALGMITRRLQFGRRVGRSFRFSLPVLVALLLPSILLLEWVEQGSNYRQGALFFIYEPLLVALMIPALVYASRGAASKSSVVQDSALWLGERSYSLYLWHFPIILAIFGRGPESQPAHMSYVAIRVLAVAVLSLVAAAASYSAIEKPARLYGRRVADRWKRRVPDAAVL
ncbi:MAG: acyltransferase [Actinomycetota bacterium]|nr:acyltransferase [Actinomycetota bacterium]